MKNTGILLAVAILVVLIAIAAMFFIVHRNEILDTLIPGHEEQRNLQESAKRLSEAYSRLMDNESAPPVREPIRTLPSKNLSARPAATPDFTMIRDGIYEPSRLVFADIALDDLPVDEDSIVFSLLGARYDLQEKFGDEWDQLRVRLFLRSDSLESGWIATMTVDANGDVKTDRHSGRIKSAIRAE